MHSRHERDWAGRQSRIIQIFTLTGMIGLWWLQWRVSQEFPRHRQKPSLRPSLFFLHCIKMRWGWPFTPIVIDLYDKRTWRQSFLLTLILPTVYIRLNVVINILTWCVDTFSLVVMCECAEIHRIFPMFRQAVGGSNRQNNTIQQVE